eukprot:4264136-Pleurochrysis_carterae.AAC.1
MRVLERKESLRIVCKLHPGARGGGKGEEGQKTGFQRTGMHRVKGRLSSVCVPINTLLLACKHACVCVRARCAYQCTRGTLRARVFALRV